MRKNNRRRRPSGVPFREESEVLVGVRSGDVWVAHLHRPTRGEVVRVEADAAWAWWREEQYGDLLGFYHTHPPRSGVAPSATDEATMWRWVDALGRPLLCVIRSGSRTRSTVFTRWNRPGIPAVRTIWIDRTTMVVVSDERVEIDQLLAAKAGEFVPESEDPRP